MGMGYRFESYPLAIMFDNNTMIVEAYGYTTIRHGDMTFLRVLDEDGNSALDVNLDRVVFYGPAEADALSDATGPAPTPEPQTDGFTLDDLINDILGGGSR